MAGVNSWISRAGPKTLTSNWRRASERNVFHRSIRTVAGIVDQDIDAALLGTNSLSRLDDGPVIGEIKWQQDRPLPFEICHAVKPPRCCVGCVAMCNQSSYGCLADSG